ncbi:MAG: cytochrome c3 family protein [Planctomycetota bacterium]
MDRFYFPPWVNKFTLMVLAGLGGGGAYAGAMLAFGTWPEVMNTGYMPEQPVPFSHKLHAGELKMDCRYCHNTVDVAAHAAVPSNNVCTNCHSGLGADGAVVKTAVHPKSIKLQKVRDSQATGEPVEWERIHDLADYVYFNHSVHINKGVSCVECHGRIDKMEVVYQAEPLSMSWCLECHRNPTGRLRPADEITNLAWTWEDDFETYDQYVNAMQEEYGGEKSGPYKASTNCSTCHR